MRRLLPVLLCLLGAACDDGASGDPPAECTYNSDCATREICVDRACIPECREDREKRRAAFFSVPAKIEETFSR